MTAGVGEGPPKRRRVTRRSEKVRVLEQIVRRHGELMTDRERDVMASVINDYTLRAEM